MNKQQQRSIHTIQTNVLVIKQIADQERQHAISQRRKRAIESFYRSVVLRAHTLDLSMPPLGMFSQSEEYIAHSDSILVQITEKDSAETTRQESR